MSSHILDSARKKGKRVYFCVHRRQLIDQVKKELIKQNIPHGIIAAGHKLNDELVQICMQQTLIRRQVAPAELLIIDECHLQPNIYKRIIEANPNAYVIGLSATPELSGGGALNAFNTKVETIDTEFLINNGTLSPYKYYAPTTLDFSKCKVVGGDYAEEDVAKIIEKTAIIGDSIEHYKKYGNNGRFLNFSYNIKHSKKTAEAFTAAGYPCAHVDCETPEKERLRLMDMLVNKELVGVSNVLLYTAGTDIPTLDVIIHQRPTTSRMLKRQIDGRVLRRSDGKEYGVIIDMVNNYKKLQSLPDTPHEWRWQGFSKQKKKKGEELPEAYYTCLNCHSTFRIQKTHCPECGHERQKTEREVKEEQGVLEEIKRNQIKRSQKLEEWACKTLDDWAKLAKQRGHDIKWAMIRHAHRQKRNSNQR